jgi:hypothetical protein
MTLSFLVPQIEAEKTRQRIEVPLKAIEIG